MLEKAIEIEGLLRIIRDGQPLAETYKLLDIKVKQLAEETNRLLATVSLPAPEPQQPDFVMAPSPPAPHAQPEVVFSTPKSLPEETPLALHADLPDGRTGTAPNLTVEASDITMSSADLPEEDLAMAEEDDIILSFDDVPENYTSESTFEATTFSPENASTSENAPLTSINEEEPTLIEVTAPTEPDTTDATYSLADTPATDTPVKTPPTAPAPAAAPAPKRDMKLKAAFSLNDRFLYARELFNGNMKIFDSTLEFIEGIEEYSMVEDYFYSELDWNPEKTHVAAFMDIIRPHFKE